MKTRITDTSVTVDSLAPGDWDVTVNASNLKFQKVASASVRATIVEGETTSQYVAVWPGVPDGNLEVSMEWPSDMGIVSASATLSPPVGVPHTNAVPSTSIVTANGVSTFSTSIVVAPGFYTLSRVFTDRTGFGSGGVDAVQVESDSTTMFALSVVSGVNLSITPDISKTIPIGFTGCKTTIGQGSTMSVTATPAISKLYSSFSYQWYLNGAALPGETSATINFSASGRAPGRYRLDVVVESWGVLSSDHADFAITANPT